MALGTWWWLVLGEEMRVWLWLASTVSSLLDRFKLRGVHSKPPRVFC